MAIFTVKSRRKLLNVSLTAILCAATMSVQLLALNQMTILGIAASFPLLLTIVWGLVFGSPMPPITNLELRKLSTSEIFSRQMLSGSVSALLVGLFFAGMYSSIVPCYPVAFPLVGWISGYFCLRALSQGNLICIPLVFILTILGEGITAGQLFLMHRPGAFEHFTVIALPEALLNAVVAPFVYFPLRRLSDVSESQRALSAE